MGDKVVFLASIAPTETAIAYTGNRDGQRIKLDIPETQLGNAAGILALRRRVIRVTLEDLGPLESWRPGSGIEPGDSVGTGAPGEPLQGGKI